MASLLDRRQLNMSTKKKLLEAAAGNAGGGATYVDDVFSTYLYTGNASSQTITNGVDLDGEGGLTWFKARNDTTFHILFDTERGGTKWLNSASPNAEATASPAWVTYNSDGFTLPQAINGLNNTQEMASWTFRKAPGFFDIVTYTGNGANRTIAHNLGSVPGMIIIKRLDGTSDWSVYHRGYGSGGPAGFLNSTDAAFNLSTYWNNTDPTSTEFSLGSFANVNSSGATYVAYIFAHDAQEFGTDEDEAIIKCGSYTGNGSTDGPTIDLGWEPQFIMVKSSSSSGNWIMLDSMRGVVSGGYDEDLYANLTYTGTPNIDYMEFTATGFIPKSNNGATNGSGSDYIYVAIRRPNKPASEFAATDLFTLQAKSPGEGADTFISTGFNVDTTIYRSRASSATVLGDRLRGRSGGGDLLTDSADAEGTNAGAFFLDKSNGVVVDTDGHFNVAPAATDKNYIRYFLRRAPGFCDVVTYDGFLSSGGSGSKAHNLNAVPEMMVFKNRSTAYSWYVWHKDITAQHYIRLNEAFAETNFGADWVGADADNINFGYGHISTSQTGYSYIAYLFASVDGISKVGSYTGTAADLNVDCGFSAGARFILIKRSDGTGDWYLWDSVRGIVSGNDPYILLNSSAAEVTNTDYVDPLASGFTVTSSAPAALNASGGTYIFYAIAQEYQL